jgi:hypothetical protein
VGTHLFVEDEHGKTAQVELAGPGGTMRLAIGEPGRRSSTWRVWANPRKSDVYVAARTIAGIQKFSFHESGDWRHQWIGDNAEKYTGSSERITDRWNRPDVPDHGYSRCISIWIPHGHLDEIPNERGASDDLGYLPDAPKGHFAGIHITIATPDRGVAELKGVRPVGGFTLASGEAVIAMYSTSPITSETERTIGDAIQKTYEAYEARGESLMELPNTVQSPRLAIHGHDDKAARHVYDLALKKIKIEESAD